MSIVLEGLGVECGLEMLEGEGIVEDISVGDGGTLGECGRCGDREGSEGRSGGSSGELHNVDMG